MEETGSLTLNYPRIQLEKFSFDNISEKAKYPCEICGQRLANKGNLQLHMSKHTGLKPCFVCDVCGKSFPRRKSFNKHAKKHKGGYWNKCEICGKSYPIKKSLVYHMKSHTGQKDYKCSTCGREYTTLQCLNHHKKTHPKKYKCEICGKKYVHSHNHQRHMKIHHGEDKQKKEFVPDDKKIFAPYSLDQHKTTFTGGNQVNCNTSGNLFANAYYLIKQEVHSDQQPQQRFLECDIDINMQSYENSEHLGLHQVKHEKEDLEIQKCSICGKSYSDSVSFGEHMLEQHY